KPRLTREKVNVLADSAEVRIVVLRYLSDSESVHGVGPGPRPRVVGSEAPVPTPRIVHTPDRATRRERNSAIMPRPTLTDGFFAGANEAGGSAAGKLIRSLNVRYSVDYSSKVICELPGGGPSSSACAGDSPVATSGALGILFGIPSVLSATSS